MGRWFPLQSTQTKLQSSADLVEQLKDIEQVFDILVESPQEIVLECEAQCFSEDLDVLQEAGGAQRRPAVPCTTLEHSHCGTRTAPSPGQTDVTPLGVQLWT